MHFEMSTRNIQFVAAGISLLLSFWAIYIDPVINNDGILYVLLAETIQEGNYANAFNIYRWPFYSFFLAGLSTFLGMPLEFSANLLNIIFSIIIVVSYLSIVKLFGGDRRVIVIAAIVILLFPGINRYRSFIGRDFGFLAFYMISLFIFFKHMIKPEWYLPGIWSVFLVLAALFRIEAVPILIALPFIAWFLNLETREQRIKLCLVLSIVLGGSFLVFAWWFSGNSLGSSKSFSLFGIVEKFTESSLNEYSERLKLMRILLTQYSENYAGATLFAAYLIILFSELIRSITVPYVIFAVIGWRKLEIFKNIRVKQSWLLVISVLVVILAAALFKYFLMTGRFTLALSLTVLLIIPFIISSYYTSWKDGQHKTRLDKWFFPVMSLVILVLSHQSLNTFTGKTHYKDGGLWLKKNIKPNEKLLSNNATVVYYSGRNPGRKDSGKAWKSQYSTSETVGSFAEKLEKNEGSEYKYIAIAVKRKYKKNFHKLVKLAGDKPVKTFKNKSGDELLIFVN